MREIAVTLERAGEGGRRLAFPVRRAETRWETTVGLLGRKTAEWGLWLPGCNAIHMVFMRFAIDAVFVASDGVVTRVAAGLSPWRMAWDRSASEVLELPAGAAAALDIRVGDRLVAD